MIVKKVFLLPIVLSGFLMLAFASCSNPTEERDYGRWDEDQSASLDDREFQNAWSEVDYFRRWDANNDSYIDESEWNTAKNEQLSQYDGSFQEWDSDSDNRLSEEEFRIGIYTYFDRDGDRMINEEEYNAWSMPGKDQEPATEVD